MTQLNEYYLLYYQKTTHDSLAFLNYFSICSMILFTAISLLLGCFIDSYCRFRYKQDEACFHFLAFIPNQLF